MEKINKYWYIHWGCSFFTLDIKCHDLWVETIWDCMTSNASIYYSKPIEPNDKDSLVFDINVVSQTKSSVLIQWKILKDNEVYVTWMFTFIKIKK